LGQLRDAEPSAFGSLVLFVLLDCLLNWVSWISQSHPVCVQTKLPPSALYTGLNAGPGCGKQGCKTTKKPSRMSWVSGFLVTRADEHKTAWGERNGRKRWRKRDWRRRYMSCLADPEAAEAPPHAGAGAGTSTFSTRCVWQEDHYGKKGDLTIEDGESKRMKEEDEDEKDEDGEVGTTMLGCLSQVVHVFQSKQFESAKLERLYQRYFFRLNQSSLTMLMGVLVLVCGLMLTFHCVLRTQDVNVPYVSVLAVAMALFLSMMVVCNRTGFHQDCMWIVSYLVVVVLVVVQSFGVFMVEPRSASEGIWTSVFFVYITYTLLPVRMTAAVLCGVALSSIHLITAWRLNLEDSFLWKQ
ncbi:adenylate cyclase type 6-like, partial [Clarias magur]